MDPMIFKFIEKERAVRDKAFEIHQSVNQMYGDVPYSHHLESTVNEIITYADVQNIFDEDGIVILAGAYFHDSIEDARLTYNDVIKTLIDCGLSKDEATRATDIVYACTNEKGKTRAERANEKYYEGIRNTEYAPLVKCADRLANLRHAVMFGNKKKVEMYRKEMPHFLQSVVRNDNENEKMYVPEKMINELNRLLELC